MDKYIKKDMEDSLGENVRRYFEGELLYQSLKERKKERLLVDRRKWY